MAFGKIRSSGLLPGKLVPLVLNMLPGEPVVHVEHLGETNASYLNDSIAQANSQAEAKVLGIKGKGQKISAAKLKERREKQRKTLEQHAIRHIDAVHDDGRPATDADIPEFVAAVPDDVVDLMWAFANDVENWRERPIESGRKELEELAEK